MSYIKELEKFLWAADKQIISQGTTVEARNFNRERITEYKSLKIDASFGQGRATAVPWISFLGKNQTTSNGIYPVYLYYKEHKLLFLSYGVSETNKPLKNWNLPNLKTLKNYFLENGLGKHKKYGNSYFFKLYDTKTPLIQSEIDKDLNLLIDTYKQTLALSKPNIETSSFEALKFWTSASKANLQLSKKLAVRFISSLLTKPFVILTGLSGSGKTKLAQAFVSWICEDESQYCLVPVGADWTNREPLLGFPNALMIGEYVKPENGVLDLLIEANKHENDNKPYFLILDEMNLSHVERYFADFLSVMESNGHISLHSGDENWGEIPPNIQLPPNLFIIGTVNIDETTYMFSPKVLDRANVIEFRVTAEEMEDYLDSSAILDLDSIKSAGANMAESFVDISNDKTLETKNAEELKSELLTFFTELKKIGAEFGYRSASEIFRFSAVVNAIDKGWKTSEIIDAAIMQKLLPKVHGSRRKIEPVLKTLGNLCLTDGQNIEDFISPQTEFDFSASEKIKYPLSLEKILRMYQGLLDNGFTSYAEA